MKKDDQEEMLRESDEMLEEREREREKCKVQS